MHLYSYSVLLVGHGWFYMDDEETKPKGYGGSALDLSRWCDVCKRYTSQWLKWHSIEYYAKPWRCADCNTCTKESSDD